MDYQTTRLRTTFRLAAGLLIVASFGLQLLHFFAHPLSFDEGVHLITAKLIQAGYQPYTQIFIGYPPMFVALLSIAWGLGHAILSSKLAFLLINTLLLLVLLAMAQALLPGPARLISLLLLILAPAYIIYAGAILADLPAVLFGSLALWLTWRYRETAQPHLLLLAGLAFALSILTKLLMPFVPLLVGFILLPPTPRPLDHSTTRLPDHQTTRPPDRPLSALLRDLLIFAGGCLATLILFAFFFDLGRVYETTVHFRLALRAALSLDLAGNGAVLATFLRLHLPLVIGALLGLLLPGQLPRPARGFIGAWVLLALAWLLIQIPLRAHHLVLLLPPLALAGGWGWWQVSCIVRDQIRRGGTRQPAWAAGPFWVVLLLIGGFGLWFHYTILRSNADYLIQRQIPRRLETMSGRQEILDRVGRLTSPHDCVISDDPVLLLDMKRLPPPELAEPSIARIRAHYLTTPYLVDVADRYGCQAVIVTKDRFKTLPALRDWSAQNFFFVSEKDIKTYSAKKDTPQQPTIRLEQGFVNGVTLIGVDLNGPLTGREQQGFISFYWRLQNKVTRPYKVFIHLRDAAGQTVFQLDRFSFNNEIPVSAWPQQATIKDTNWFELPGTLPPGEYQFFVGLYDPETGQRLALRQDKVLSQDSGENAVNIGKIIVQ